MASRGGRAQWNPRAQRWEVQESPDGLLPEPPDGLLPGPRDGAEPAGAGAGLPPRPSYPPGAAAGADADGEAPARRRRVRRWAVPAAAVAAALALVLGVGWGTGVLAGWPFPGKPPAVPPGYQVLHYREAGFRVAVPGGWQLSSSESGTGAGAVYRPSATGTAFLQVFEVTDAATAPCEVLVEGTRDLSARDGYRRLSLTETPGRGCEIVHELPDGSSGATGRGIGRLTVASDGSRWVLMAYGPAAEAAAVRTRITAALASFARE